MIRNVFRLAAFAVFWGCTAVTSFAAPAKQAGMLVSTEWLAHSSGEPSVVVLQVVRDQGSYDKGHIPGARPLLLGQIVTAHDGNDNELPAPEQLRETFEAAGVSNTSRVVLYDDAQGLFASRAYFTLDYLGLGSKTSLLDGGLQRWVADGRRLSREAPQFARGRITPAIRPGIVVTFPQMYALSGSRRPGSVIIDVRAPQYYNATGPAAASRPGPGHIPGAHNIFWMDTIESGTNPVRKNPETLRSMYRESGLKQGVRAVVYCNTGMQASHTYFTLKWLGYDVAMYDGSFQEWARHPEVRIETTASR